MWRALPASAAARRFGKVPPGKRLRTRYERDGFEIRLEQASPGTDVEEHAVPVARVSKLHPVARRFRDCITKTLEAYRGERWSGSRDGHLVVTIRGHDYDPRVSGEKVSLRGDWERERQRRAEDRFGYLSSRVRLEPFDKDATGRLMITLDSGYSRGGRHTTWVDRKSWALEVKRAFGCGLHGDAPKTYDLAGAPVKVLFAPTTRPSWRS